MFVPLSHDSGAEKPEAEENSSLQRGSKFPWAVEEAAASVMTGTCWQTEGFPPSPGCDADAVAHGFVSAEDVRQL